MSVRKNRQKRQKKRSILIALLMIMLTGVILTTSTYAWFTANKTVTVSNIDVNVAATNGLQISVDATNWKTVITNDDINGVATAYPTSVNQLPSAANSLNPVSTVKEIDATTGFMKMFLGELTDSDGNYILTTSQSTETRGTAGNFVAFDLFFQVQQETIIYLTSNSNVTVPDGKTSTGIQNAARVAFIDSGNVTAGSSASDAQKLKAAANASVVLWEPNYDVHTAAAVKAAKDYYNKDTQETGATQLEYYGVKTAISAADKVAVSSTADTYFTKITPDISTAVSGIPDTAYKQLMTLQPGITKVRVYMWVEGQDVDCENFASGGYLSYNLQFSSNPNANAS